MRETDLMLAVMPWPMLGPVLIVAGYLCGAIPFGLLAGWLRGVDIRTQGSGNIGATNAGRVLGRPIGVLVFALDVAKGAVPVALYGYSRQGAADATSCLVWIAIGAACIFGHMFPVYLRFKGGKGVATSLGVLLGLYPYYTWPGLIALGLWVVVTAATRYVSVGSMTAAVAFPILFAIMAHFRADAWGGPGQLWPLYLFAVAVAPLVVYRHKSNLRRLMAGTESRIGSSKRPAV